MTLGDIIKQYRRDHDLSMRDFAAKCDLSTPYISMLERGKNSRSNKAIIPSMSTLNKVSTAMGISFSKLLSLLDTDYPIQIGSKNIQGLQPVPLHDVFRVPVIGSVRCGPGGIAYEYIDEYIAIDAQYNPDGIRGFRAVGDSMTGDNITDGDLVLVRLQDEVSNGHLAVVVIDGEEGTLKRIRYDEVKGILTLESSNPDYPPRVFVGPEINTVKIVGEVVELRKKLA